MKRFESSPGFHYYELPTISKLNPIARWFINRGMRGGIPDPEARARTITLYLDKTEFKKALKLPDESQIYALLVDRMGGYIGAQKGTLTKPRRRLRSKP